MILGFLRFVAFTLMFMFIYRVVVGAFRYISGDGEKRQKSRPQNPQSEPKNAEPPAYGDVKDADFKDLPPDQSKPS